MPITTKRWDDPVEPDDGHRLLVARYRPRALPKEEETWHAWDASLGPSTALHAAYYGKSGLPLSWAEYRQRYLREQLANRGKIRALAERVAGGETITLLCSSACTRESRCHRSLLRELIERQLAEPG